MKSLLFIMPSLGGGGAEKVLVDIFNNMDYSQYRVSLLVLYYFGPYTNAINSNVEIFKVFDGSRSSILHRAIRKGAKILHIYNRYINRKINHIITREYDTIISFTSGQALFLHSFLLHKGRRNISWVHIDMLKNHASTYPFKSHDAEQKAYSQMNHIVFVSYDAQTAFNKIFTFPNFNESVIYNPIDKQAIIRKSKEFTTVPCTIISIGRLVPVKGFDRLLRVAKMLKDNGYKIKINILGTGVLESELKTYAHKLRISDMVSFVGFQANPYPFIKNADIYISTSISEAFSLVIAESMTLGCAIISTKTTGPTEMINDKYGILTEHDEISIFNAVKHLLDNPTEMKRLQKMALERSKILNMDSTMQSIYSIL